MTSKVVTEREVFEAVMSMLGRSTSRDDGGKYSDEQVEWQWSGWKWRADAEKARNTQSALSLFRQFGELK